jgi:hypothetical protein
MKEGAFGNIPWRCVLLTVHYHYPQPSMAPSQDYTLAGTELTAGFEEHEEH